MNTLEILTAARQLISKEENWTQGHFARESSGRTTDVWNGQATCWCSVGAILSVIGPTNVEDAQNLAESMALLSTECGGVIADFNDSRTHSEVLAAFDRAILKLTNAQENAS